MMEPLELRPSTFFALQGELLWAPSMEALADDRYLLPPVWPVRGENYRVAIGWDTGGLLVQADLKQRLVLELWIDTRDVKTSNTTTPFCHHFLCSSDLASDRSLSSEPLITSKGKTIEMFLPAQALHGYDPEQFDRLGLAYRLSLEGEPVQHFSLDTSNLALEQNPSFWASFTLTQPPA